MEDVKAQRIKLVIAHLKTKGIIKKQEDLCSILGISDKTRLSQLVNYRVENNKFINELTELDPTINIKWLLTGEGEMLFRDTDNLLLTPTQNTNLLPTSTDVEVVDAEVIEVPYVSQSIAQDPHLDIKELIENQEIETRNLLTLLGNFDGVQSVFRNAMEPMYHRGDLLLFRYVSITGRLQQGTYIVDIDDMGAMLGMLIDNGQTIELSFLNPNFKPFSIARNKLRSAATIVRHIRDERSLSIMPKKPYDMENINKMLAQHDAFLHQQKALIAQHDAFLHQQDKLIDYLTKK